MCPLNKPRFCAEERICLFRIKEIRQTLKKQSGMNLNGWHVSNLTLLCPRFCGISTDSKGRFTISSMEYSPLPAVSTIYVPTIQPGDEPSPDCHNSSRNPPGSSSIRRSPVCRGRHGRLSLISAIAVAAMVVRVSYLFPIRIDK
jgi:hypothetical protein